MTGEEGPAAGPPGASGSLKPITSRIQAAPAIAGILIVAASLAVVALPGRPRTGAVPPVDPPPARAALELPAPEQPAPAAAERPLKTGPAPSRILAPALRTGDCIALIAPASPANPGEIADAASNLRKLGYRVKVSPAAAERFGYLAGSDEARAESVNRAFADPEVKLILCVRGGYGSPRILPRIDYDLIRRSPKAIVGYSDITALLVAIHQRTGLVTFHGPMAGKDFSGRTGLSPFADQHLFALLGPEPFDAAELPYSDWGAGLPGGAGARRTISGGVAEGRLTGGNLSTVAALMGTPFEIDTRGAILFLEEVNEEPFRIDRMLCQFALAGKFAAAKGILLGGFTRCDAKSPKESLALPHVFETYFEGLGVPVLAGFPAGHMPQQAALPLGIRVRLDASAKTLAILEPAVDPGKGAGAPPGPPAGSSAGAWLPQPPSRRSPSPGRPPVAAPSRSPAGEA